MYALERKCTTFQKYEHFFGETLCSSLLLPAHITRSYPLQNRAGKVSGKLGSAFLQKEGRCPLKSSYTIPNAVHSTDLLVNDLAHK